MSTTVICAREISAKTKVPIQEASTNSLALGAVKILTTTPAWVYALIMDDSEAPFVGSYTTIMQQLVIRTSAGYSAKNVREVVPTMAATHTIVVEKGKENVFITNDYNEVKMQTIAGIQVPTNYPNAHVKCVMTSLMDGAYIGVSSKKLEANYEINPLDAQAIRFPFKALVVDKEFPKGATRAGFITGTFEKAIRDKGYAEAIAQNDLPDGVVFDFATGKYRYNSPAMLGVKDARALFYAIMAHRKTRGSDKDARHYITAPYYYGIPTRSLYQNGYMIADIQALGAALKTKVLEITNTDQLINAHVMSSLVATGWLIRVVGSNQYPERIKNTQGYVQKKGVFSYFEHDDVFLRWYYVRETAPKVVGHSVLLPTNTPDVVNQLFSISKSTNAIPFGYVYVNDQMLQLEKHYPGCSLFPTAHAHNGHVIVVRARIDVPVVGDWSKRTPFKVADVIEEKQGKEEIYKTGPLDYKLYLRRVMEACIWKTYYVFSRTRYLEVDPFAHHVSFYMRNQKIIDEKDFVKLSFEDEVNRVFDFDRTMAIKSDGAKYIVYLPQVVERKRMAQTAVLDTRKKLKVERDLDKIVILEQEEKDNLSEYLEAQQEIKKEDALSKGLTPIEVLETTGDPQVLEIEEADPSFFVQERDEELI